MPTHAATVAEHPDAPACLRRGGMHWLCFDPYRDVFFDEQGLRLSQWIRDGQATVVKKGPHRVVYRVDLEELSFYVKQNRMPDARTWLRHLVRPGKAWMEYRRALAIAARGIPTVEPLAIGEPVRRVVGGESFLITRSLPEAIQLNVFLETILPCLPPVARQQIRKRLARALGRFIALLHNKGVLHNDLHCGNLLIRTEDNEPCLYLIDLQSVRLGRPLNWSQSKANLVIFNRWLSLRASRADRLRFWLAYQAARDAAGWTPSPPAVGARGLKPFHPLSRELVHELETATRRSNERFWRRRGQRCLQVTRRTQRLRMPGLLGFAVSDLDPALLEQLQRDPEAPFRMPGAVMLKDSRSARVVAFTTRVGGEPQAVIYKRFAVTRWYDPLVALLRPSPALRSWLHGHGLRERGLPTARPLAFFHRQRWGLPREGYLLMERVNASGDLREALDALATVPEPERRRVLRDRLGQLARLVRELHCRHLAHRDLKAANILLHQGADSSDAGPTPPAADEWQASPFYFIDLVGVSCPHRLRRVNRVKNLARLHASFHCDQRLTRTDKLRFLRTYLQWGIFGRGGWKRWWRAVERATGQKIQQNIRRRRPLA